MNTTTLNMTTLDGGVIIKKGGGTSPKPPSWGNSYRYFDTTKATVTEGSPPIINFIFSVFKINNEGLYTAITCNAPPLEEWEAKHVVATATDFNLKVYNPVFANLEGIMTIEEIVNSLGGVEAMEQALGFTEITEEQFYSLD